MTSTQTHTGKLRVGFGVAYVIFDEHNGKVASCVTAPKAAELVRRWNAHEAMLEALEAIAGEQGGYSDRMPWKQVRAAIAAAKGGGG